MSFGQLKQPFVQSRGIDADGAVMSEWRPFGNVNLADV